MSIMWYQKDVKNAIIKAWLVPRDQESTVWSLRFESNKSSYTVELILVSHRLIISTIDWKLYDSKCW